MRWIVLAAVAALASLSVHASEPVAESVPIGEPPTPILSHELPPLSEAKPVPKPKIGKKVALKKSMLSRTARSQMALLAAPARSAGILAKLVFDDNDSGDGASDLDLHRSFVRPKVVKHDLDDHDDIAVADEVRLRLFMARMKAIEAYTIAQAAKHAEHADLTDTAKLRLLMARQMALRAHQRKFT